MMRTFNTAGKCIPSMHYMVDISRQVDAAAKMVYRGNYFCINRGRQYGKTTTLSMLKKRLEGEEYAAGNHIEFVQFLGLLREMYLKRDTRPTFLSVILAGVYDIKNLKLKLRPEDQHQYNSPWNIAMPFDTDMSLPADGIAGMLNDYKADHHLSFDEKQGEEKKLYEVVV